MKKELPLLSSLALLLFSACGDTVENTTINQTGIEVVSSVDELPKCSAENEGNQAIVEGESSIRVCIKGGWFLTSAGTAAPMDFSCTTVELEDKSGLKIVCNGDSVGVVLNGVNGKDGEDGRDAEIVKSDTSVVDSEKIAVSLDSLAGFTQKGPFLKGSTVYLYELSDGRTLKQTNGNFTSKITRDDGHYKFTARDLVSQYAMVVVDGYYRNEVTGGTSDAPLRLTAITDMRKRSSVNVNLLTHLEFDRVYRLVTRGDSMGKKLTVKQAKQQAQKEILNQFHIELAKDADAEDMDVFGKTDADAALLAVSVLLQRDSGATPLSVLLTEISNDIAEYGEWRDSVTKAKIADWAMVADTSGELDEFKENVTRWGFGEAPDYKKFVRNFWSKIYGLGDCTGDRKNKVVAVMNKRSGYYGTQLRFICKDGEWTVASDLEKDRYDWSGDKVNDGTLLEGLVTGKKMVWDGDTLRYADAFENNVNRGCVKDMYGTKDTLGLHSSWTCTSAGWSFDSVNVFTDPRDSKTYKTIKIGDLYWMAENLNYKTDSSYCYQDSQDSCAKYGRLYNWGAAMEACPAGWHLPDLSEMNSLFYASGTQTEAGIYLKSKTGWLEFTAQPGKDILGFAALPAGRRNGYNYGYIGLEANFWTSTPYSNNIVAYYMGLDNSSDAASMTNMSTNYSISVRCVMDKL